MSGSAYSGVDNLEAMVDAKNYNEFLVREVLRHRGEATTAVDFGAGIGMFARGLRGHALRVVAVETDERLRRTLCQEGFECHASLDTIPPGSVEYLFSLNVLEHIEHDDAVIRDWYECLRPGGRVYVYVPAFNVLYSSMDRKVGHYRRYRRGALAAQLRRAGFEIQSARYADSLGFFATLFYQWLGNRRGDLNAAALRCYDRVFFPLSRMLDLLVGRWVGKNLAIAAVRPREAATCPVSSTTAGGRTHGRRPVPASAGV